MDSLEVKRWKYCPPHFSVLLFIVLNVPQELINVLKGTVQARTPFEGKVSIVNVKSDKKELWLRGLMDLFCDWVQWFF